MRVVRRARAMTQRKLMRVSKPVKPRTIITENDERCEADRGKCPVRDVAFSKRVRICDNKRFRRERERGRERR